MKITQTIFVNHENQTRADVIFDLKEKSYSIRVRNFAGLLLASVKLATKNLTQAEYFAKVAIQMPEVVEAD